VIVGAVDPDVRQIGAFEIEPPAIEQRKIRVEADADGLPGVVLDDHRHAVRNAAGADVGV